MTFNPNIPQGTQAISQSAAPIQTNFSQSNTLFSVDHVTFNSADAGNRGKHYKVTYPEWVMPPQATVDPITAANEIAFYSKDVGGATRGFMRQGNNGTIIQTTGTDPVEGPPGSSFLPGVSTGAFSIKWGQFNFPNLSTSQPVLFTTSFSTNAITVIITSTSSDPLNTAGVNQGSLSSTGFTAIRAASPANNLTYHYIAIGR